MELLLKLNAVSRHTANRMMSKDINIVKEQVVAGTAAETMLNIMVEVNSVHICHKVFQDRSLTIHIR